MAILQGRNNEIIMSEIRFNNLADLPQPELDQKYIFNNEGWAFVECFTGYGKVSGSMRKRWMYASLINLIWLNEEIEELDILAIALSANENKLLPKLPEREVRNMVKTLFHRHLEVGLTPNYSRKKVMFNEEIELSGRERQILALEANIQMKKNDKLNTLYRILEDWNFDINGKITQRAIIALKAGIGKKAVEKYYREFIDYIEIKNKEFMALGIFSK